MRRIRLPWWIGLAGTLVLAVTIFWAPEAEDAGPAQAGLVPTSLFASRGALAEAIRASFCKALDRERAKRRGGRVNPASEDPFDQCVDPTASTILLGSSNQQQFDRIGILIAPYEAGPYAEGDYEITLPVTKAVLMAVKPQYRSVFALGR